MELTVTSVQTDTDRAYVEVPVDLARTLHDVVAQELFVARLTLHELVDRLPPGSADRRIADRALGHVTAALAATRHAIDGLRDAREPSETDLATALGREVADFAERTGIAVSFREAAEPDGLAPVAAAQVLAIVREALTNIDRHACASEVQLSVRHHHGWLRIVIADDGTGFRAEPVRAIHPGLGFGITTMHERARAIGGRLSLRSETGAGTIVTVDVPVDSPVGSDGGPHAS